MTRRLLALIAIAVSARAVGTVSESITQLGTSGNYVLVFNWAGDASTGSVPIVNTNGACDGVHLICTPSQGPLALAGLALLSVETGPGKTPAPTNGYSVQILDGSGADLLGGAAVACSSTLGQSWSPAVSAPPLTAAGISLALTGQSVAAATGSVYVFLGPPSTAVARAKGGGGGSAVWGGITGALSSQGDLETALNAKLGISANAVTATALDAVPTQCTGEVSIGIAANGNASCIPVGSFQLVNDPTVGTALYNTATMLASGNAETTNTGGGTQLMNWVVVLNGGTTGSASLALNGLANLQMDANGATAQHWIQSSTLTAGRGLDAGSTPPCGVWILGQAQTGAAANANAIIVADGFMLTCPAAAAWGSITGVLSSQTDLQSALNAKLASTGNAVTATALAATPTQCSGAQFAQGVAASGNANCATPAGGGGSSLPSFNVTTSATVITMAPGSVLTAANGVTVLAGAYTITFSAGADTGDFYVGPNASNQAACYYGSGITIANWTVAGFAGSTCTSGSPPTGIYTVTVPVVSGVVSSAPTQYQPVSVL